MATSDNVVRAGLTPKLRDVDTLVNMLDYNYGPSSEFLISGKPYEESITSFVYDPPVPEFAVMRTSLREGESEFFPGIEGPSILIVVSGNGKILEEMNETSLVRGGVYFIAANTKVTIFSASPDFCVYRAFCDCSH